MWLGGVSMLTAFSISPACPGRRFSIAPILAVRGCWGPLPEFPGLTCSCLFCLALSWLSPGPGILLSNWPVVPQGGLWVARDLWRCLLLALWGRFQAQALQIRFLPALLPSR